ncbi:NAD(P)-dependent oxidoreductase [Tenacibaculum finnmarkense]|uniref:3-phosphoglycerate dehydrogenase n=1 Tax=Tenacibaculum finnmarkense genomovar ulcerans TaxID=2781388 RepID=A0A2I2MB56_9FLAO|nr:NAD(P)-dependent oxidoreductase [Tenacibaculum finnmarkense]ALU75084.1 3-phosphoglycerate dehydrogenase [Tenacibaculum dicentrarchi]MBE7697795.1 3-phosphoglycerate dehydrogenase [Tenacibaculum finnmarkense genomovar ulcerans]MCD8400006.1 3-phosphoglycerate dehydrogenase [Tenacibaculum finnmarkense genomovar ulcerans]MCD8410107.1 3-phosphoglycerate dehydrogenase [Tenacibaculum finnmarkense genomovar ulcerans]MCG8785387.1 3-phosphoglycerate dehydrogenase [Tenacibaculum finnmarkense]
MKILVNDGILDGGTTTLENAGFEVITTKVAQEQLDNFINEEQINVVVIKNSTEIHAELIDNCPTLKLIANASTTNDNIDVVYAQECGVQIINVSDASANAVAELVFAHLLTMARFLHQANREMPLEGDTSFNALKKQFSAGTEVRGKTLGIIGMSTEGQQVAKLALGLGMKVIAYDVEFGDSITIPIEFYNGQAIDIEIDFTSADDLLKEADFITVHLASEENHVIGVKEFEKMKKGVGFINVSQSGLVDEIALVNAIESGKVQYAGLDTFENQPTPEIQLLMNPELSLSPNIASFTVESQHKIGTELANKIINSLHV